MYVQYKMNPCSGIKEVESVDVTQMPDEIGSRKSPSSL